MENIHEGHRKRLRERFRATGLTGMNDINILELLLFYTVPRADTNALAHRLLDAFGSLRGVVFAPEQALARVEGMGESGAMFFALLQQLMPYVAAEEMAFLRSGCLRTPEDIADFVLPRYYGMKQEMSCLLCMKATGKALELVELGRGSSVSVIVTPRLVVQEALRTGAQVCVLVHNHPHTSPEPSEGDQKVTAQIAESLKNVEVLLADHIIIGDNAWYAFSEDRIHQQLDWLEGWRDDEYEKYEYYKKLLEEAEEP